MSNESHAPRGLSQILFISATIGALNLAAHAVTVGYWRMEVDTDATAAASIPNEIASGTPLISTAGLLDAAVPVSPVPQTGAQNSFGLDALGDINGTAASYPALNVGSLTVEGWFRTNEGTATLFGRTSGTTGFFLDSANNVTAHFFVGGTQFNLAGTSAIDLSFGSWTHLAFTYDSASGVANIYADGNMRGSLTVPGGGALFSATDNIPLAVGTLFDGGDGGVNIGSLVDEVRISDTALLPTQFLLSVPEPGILGGIAREACLF